MLVVGPFSVDPVNVGVSVFGIQSPHHRDERAGAGQIVGIATPVQLAEVEQRLAAVLLKKLLWEQITGIVATTRIRGRLRIRVVVRVQDFSKIVEEVPILERLRVGVRFEPHMREVGPRPGFR